MARALRKHTTIWDSGSDHYRAAKVKSITGGTSVIRVLCEAHGPERDITVNTASLPCASKGAPLCAKVDIIGGPSAYTVIALLAAHWGSVGPGTDEAGSIDRGEHHFPVVPRSITGESEEYEWTR